jgi:hypothetical protein
MDFREAINSINQENAEFSQNAGQVDKLTFENERRRLGIVGWVINQLHK